MRWRSSLEVDKLGIHRRAMLHFRLRELRRLINIQIHRSALKECSSAF